MTGPEYHDAILSSVSAARAARHATKPPHPDCLLGSWAEYIEDCHRANAEFFGNGFSAEIRSVVSSSVSDAMVKALQNTRATTVSRTRQRKPAEPWWQFAAGRMWESACFHPVVTLMGGAVLAGLAVLTMGVFSLYHKLTTAQDGVLEFISVFQQVMDAWRITHGGGA